MEEKSKKQWIWLNYRRENMHRNKKTTSRLLLGLIAFALLPVCSQEKFNISISDCTHFHVHPMKSAWKWMEIRCNHKIKVNALDVLHCIFFFYISGEKIEWILFLHSENGNEEYKKKMRNNSCLSFLLAFKEMLLLLWLRHRESVIESAGNRNYFSLFILLWRQRQWRRQLCIFLS